jgi:hypothetical protein
MKVKFFNDVQFEFFLSLVHFCRKLSCNVNINDSCNAHEPCSGTEHWSGKGGRCLLASLYTACEIDLKGF